MTLSYQQAGVDVALGDAFVERIKAKTKLARGKQLIPAAGGYAAVSPVTCDKWIALTTDGVGTKVLLAHQLGKHRSIGIDLVAMCANDLICVGATPTLFLDYFATGKLDLAVGEQLIDGIIDGCEQAGMALVGGETAEMPDIYEASQYDLAGFAVGELAPEQLITGKAIRPGQKLIGLASSGIHSNGLSLARKCLTQPADLEALLTPTLIYVKPILSVLKAFPQSITGMVHVTGGGVRNFFRLNPEVGYRIDTPMPVLPIFKAILASGVSEDEAYKTFNMGMGLMLIVQQNEDAILAQLKASGLEAQLIGVTTDQANTAVLPSKNLTFSADNPL